MNAGLAGLDEGFLCSKAAEERRRLAGLGEEWGIVVG